MRRTSFFKSHRPSTAIYLVSLAGILISVGAVMVIGFDVWWHLATGWVMSNLHEIPRYDLFSYTAFGAPWFNQEWLFQLMQWQIYSAAGTAGLIAAKFAMIAITTIILFRTIAYLSRSRNIAVWGTLFFLWGASNRVVDRPFLLGMCLLALCCLILHKYVREGTRAIWLLPLLQIFWINCHGSGFLGVQIMGAFALGESLQALIGKRLGGPDGIERIRIRRLWLITAASLAACTINPWGAGIFTFYLDISQASNILKFTAEWLPPLHPGIVDMIPPLLFLITALATFAAFIANAGRARISHLIVAAGMTILLTKGHRFGPEMMIVCIPIMLANFSERFPKARGASNTASWINVAAAFTISAMALTFGVPVSLKGGLWNPPGWGVAGISSPDHMIQFLERNDIRGRVLNDMGLGGYLIFRRWPRERVFIDGRTPIYGDSFYKEFVEAFQNDRNFEKLAAKYGFDYIAMQSFNAWKQRKFHNYLWRHPGWHLVYATSEGFVYLRDVPKFKALIDKFGLEKHPVVEAIEREGAQQ